MGHTKRQVAKILATYKVKQCSKCDEYKDISEFHRSSKSRNLLGVVHICKSCSNISNRLNGKLRNRKRTLLEKLKLTKPEEIEDVLINTLEKWKI